MSKIANFLDSMTLGEVEDYETLTGEPITDVYENKLIGKTTRVLYTIYKQRTNPEFTSNDARKVNPVSALEELEKYDPKVTTEA